MTEPFTAYGKLLKRAREIALFAGQSGLLFVGRETRMPPKALAFRAGQLAHFGGQAHRLFTAKRWATGFPPANSAASAPGSDEAANVREWRRSYDRATRVPARLVEKSPARLRATPAKPGARRANGPNSTVQTALAKGAGPEPADGGMLGLPGIALRRAASKDMSRAHAPSQLRALFAELRPAIVAILGPAMSVRPPVPEDLLHGNYPVAAQQAFNRQVAEAMGFDFQAGRIDTDDPSVLQRTGAGRLPAHHPLQRADFTQSLYGIMHEAGHGLYEQGLAAGTLRHAAGHGGSLGIHESQSRLWENHVGRSPAFLGTLASDRVRVFPGTERLTPAQITAAVNRVRPSFIRVEADQVTYDLHIILRFEIEVKLIEGS